MDGEIFTKGKYNIVVVLSKKSRCKVFKQYCLDFKWKAIYCHDHIQIYKSGWKWLNLYFPINL